MLFEYGEEEVDITDDMLDRQLKEMRSSYGKITDGSTGFASDDGRLRSRRSSPGKNQVRSSGSNHHVADQGPVVIRDMSLWETFSISPPTMRA